MTDPVTPSVEERRARGMAMFREVYGGLVPAPPSGASRAFELLVLEQQFAEVWSRPGLAVLLRRMLTIGVVTARGEYQTLELQFRCSLELGDLSIEEVREAAIHLISYAGTPAAGGILAASESAIASYLERNESGHE